MKNLFPENPFPKNLFLLCFLLIAQMSFSQNSIDHASLETTGLTGSKSSLPFWFSHNRLGKYSTGSNIQELTEGKLFGNTPLDNKLKLDYGAHMALLFTENGTRAKIIQAYAGLRGRTFTLKAGAFADEEILGGLSSGNGSMVRSLNYRPYPMIRLSTSGFVPFLFAKGWLQVRAEYDEGLLWDERVVDHPHLHHKSLAFRFLADESFRLTAGMDHYVFWGGTLPDGEKLPQSLKSYFRYVLGKKGSPEFLETDQFNVAGNQLGSFLLTAEKDFENYRVQVRISHPFEDRSGMEFDNVQDNLYTIYWKKKQTGSLFDEFLFEYLYSKHQSGSIHRISGPGKRMRGRDNYFNHGIYATGFSYRGYSMGTPLFSPLVRNEEGIIAGFANNRVSAFHTGAKGYLSGQVGWKAMLTYCRNFGTYDAPYESVQKQVYSLAELSWKSEKLPCSFSASLAADFGELTQIGVGCSVRWVIK
jgi:hypothetical protein